MVRSSFLLTLLALYFQDIRVIFSDSEFAGTPVAEDTPTRYASVSTLTPAIKVAGFANNFI